MEGDSNQVDNKDRSGSHLYCCHFMNVIQNGYRLLPIVQFDNHSLCQ